MSTVPVSSMSLDLAGPSRAWAYAVIWLCVLAAYGAVWTRGIQGDDLCMGELANAQGYWEAVRYWLQHWNSRLFLALSQVGTYHLPLFADPLRAPWYLLHGLVIAAHMAACGLLLHLLLRAGMTSGAALAATLVFAIHPITDQAVLWLAAAYGYVFGNLLALLAVWTFLKYRRTDKVLWLWLAVVLALASTLGIEQYLFVLGALAGVHLLWARKQAPGQPAWPVLLLLGVSTFAFAAMHFGLFSGTADRLARATQETATASGPALPWMIAWWMSLLPDASPYGGSLQIGGAILKGKGWLLGSVILLAGLAAWRVGTASSWLGPAESSLPGRRLWLAFTGVAVFVAALAPFIFTGRYAPDTRNMYVALPGLVVFGAALLDKLAATRMLNRALRVILSPLVALFVATSLTIDIGAQAIFAESWRFHQNVILAIEDDAEAIRQAGTLEMSGIPVVPYKAISQMGTGWAFPCLVRWSVRDSDVQSWNNLMGPREQPYPPARIHRIEWRHP